MEPPKKATNTGGSPSRTSSGMSLFKIAWRSIQHRGLGSFLTILSMALGVMLVVAVLTIHGVIAQSFRSNSSFGYNIIMGARGGALQLTLNTVFYLSQPIETIPYEYYLAFCDEETRKKAFDSSITMNTLKLEQAALDLANQAGAGIGSGPLSLFSDFAIQRSAELQKRVMKSEREGPYNYYTDLAVPICLGDYYEVPGTDSSYRVVGTNEKFCDDLLLDVDSGAKFEFAQGRNIRDFDEENGYFEAVIGATVARTAGLKIGSPIYPTHGVPNDPAAHVHEQGFKVVGILEPTRTANDKVVFINIEGFFLMEDHVKPIEGDEDVDDTADDIKKTEPDAKETDGEVVGAVPGEPDPFSGDQGGWDVKPLDPNQKSSPKPKSKSQQGEVSNGDDEKAGQIVRGVDVSKPVIIDLSKRPLPIEQRELTAVLIRTKRVDDADDEDFGALLYDKHLTDLINAGDMEKTLQWSQFLPRDSQKSAQGVNPIQQIEILFATLVDPIRWLLLFLTLMICIVSGISILVGIYNSMNQRRHEIAVMRALGADRTQVMLVMLLESILLATAGGLLGWIGGHALNVVASPYFESQTGVPIGFFDFAPPVPIGSFLGGFSGLPESILSLTMSPEFLIIPGLVLLAVLVGLYPALTAYRTDVSKSLGK